MSPPVLSARLGLVSDDHSTATRSRILHSGRADAVPTAMGHVPVCGSGSGPMVSARLGLVRVGMDLTELPVVGKAVWVCVVGLLIIGVFA